MTLSSRRPYLLRAIHDWINDNLLTPYLVIDTQFEGVIAPVELAQNHRLVLNIVSTAVHGLVIDNEAVGFSTRFNGRSFDIYLPINSIIAIYAQENGEGMLFSDLIDAETEAKKTKSNSKPTPPNDGGNKPKKTTLRVVK